MAAFIRCLIVFYVGSSSALAAPPKDEAPKPLPKAIVEAWKNGGAEVAWSDPSKPSRFHSVDEPTRAGWLPTFRIRSWRDGLLKGLPGPDTSFRLDLSQSGVTDAGVKELAGLKQLIILKLFNTKVTDAGLKELAGLKQLTMLDLSATRVTDEGVKEL